MLNANSPKVIAFLNTWHENEFQCGGIKHPTIESFTRVHGEKVGVEHRKYIYLDSRAGSGHFIVNRMTEEVYSIMGYGIPNKKKPRGKIEFLTQFIQNETANEREYTHRYWYALHPTE